MLLMYLNTVMKDYFAAFQGNFFFTTAHPVVYVLQSPCQFALLPSGKLQPQNYASRYISHIRHLKCCWGPSKALHCINPSHYRNHHHQSKCKCWWINFLFTAGFFERHWKKSNITTLTAEHGKFLFYARFSKFIGVSGTCLLQKWFAFCLQPHTNGLSLYCLEHVSQYPFLSCCFQAPTLDK